MRRKARPEAESGRAATPSNTHEIEDTHECTAERRPGRASRNRRGIEILDLASAPESKAPGLLVDLLQAVLAVVQPDIDEGCDGGAAVEGGRP
jgi:hypothetical protein